MADNTTSTNNANNTNNGGLNAGVDTLGVASAAPAPSTTATAVAGQAATAPVKRQPRRGGKAQPERPVRALFCLGLKNPLRKLCIDIVELKYPFFVVYDEFVVLLYRN